MKCANLIQWMRSSVQYVKRMQSVPSTPTRESSAIMTRNRASGYVLFAVTVLFTMPLSAQTQQPTYRIGERMSDGNLCHEGITQLLALDSAWNGKHEVTGTYGCDLDAARAAQRTRDINAEIVRKRYERMEREENMRATERMK